MKSIYSITYKDLQKWCESINEMKFRAKQIYDWLYVKRVNTIDEMSNLSKKLREELIKEFTMDTLTEKTRQTSLDGTTKFLFNLQDNNTVETVLMNNKYGFSLCVSTQVGCRIGCSFCASTIGGLKRNLEAGEIVSQVLKVQKALDKEGERISSIVIMGTGEPFDNFENTMKFIDIINNENGINIGARHITISTSGIVPKIYEFADMKSQINFAISLHAPNDDLRSKLMKINQAYSLKKLIEACRYYNEVTNRRLTFEYALFNGVNDNPEQANELAKLIKGIKCHVNLIPANDVVESRYYKSKGERVKTFLNILTSRGINATVRREQGDDIDAACGQLRSKYLDDKQ